jgi:SOS-response transcriptional repressor LexA
MFQTAFQANAFQNNAFQISGVPPTPSLMDTHDGFTPEEIRRAKRLDAKIRARQLALYKAQQEAKIRRKQQLRDAIDPPKIVAKQKQNKLQSIQEVKAGTPPVDTTELEQSIAYLENQRNNLLKAVAYRQEVARLQTKLAILEAKRLAELDDEESILLLT